MIYNYTTSSKNLKVDHNSVDGDLKVIDCIGLGPNYWYETAHSTKFSLPFKVFHTDGSDAIVELPHGLDDLGLGLLLADDLKLGQEVTGHGDEGVLGPAGEPVHGAARDQAGELEGAGAELLPNLSNRGERRDVNFQRNVITCVSKAVNHD